MKTYDDYPAARGFGSSASNVDAASADQRKRARAESSNPWGEQYGDMDVRQRFTGPLRGANENMMSEALRNMGQPTDFSQYNVGTGDDYRNQAIGAAQGQMGDWLGGMQGGMNDATKQGLLSQGYAEGSPEFQAAMARDTGWGADMQSTIGNAAIGLGAQGGQMLQGQAMQTSQQGLSEALRTRGYPMEALGKMQGLLDGSGPRETDDSAFQGAVMDSDWNYRDYQDRWNKAKGVQDDREDAIFGGLSAGLNAIPVFGQIANAGTSAVRGSTKKGRS